MDQFMEIFRKPEIKEKRPQGRQSKHSDSFRAMVAKRVIEEGMTYREAAKNFGMSHGSIALVVKNFKNNKFNAKRREKTTKQKKEIENYRHKAIVNDLKLEIAELYLENLMLKKMCGHFLSKKNESSSDITSENLDLLPKRAK